MDDFLQKLKKVVRIMLYGPAISQSDCRKAGPYQLPNNKVRIRHDQKFLMTLYLFYCPPSRLASLFFENH